MKWSCASKGAGLVSYPAQMDLLNFLSCPPVRSSCWLCTCEEDVKGNTVLLRGKYQQSRDSIRNEKGDPFRSLR